MTYFILQVYTGIGANHSYHRKNLGVVLEKKMQANGPEEIPGSKCSMYGPGFKGRTAKPCVFNRQDFNFCARTQLPTAVAVFTGSPVQHANL